MLQKGDRGYPDFARLFLSFFLAFSLSLSLSPLCASSCLVSSYHKSEVGRIRAALQSIFTEFVVLSICPMVYVVPGSFSAIDVSAPGKERNRLGLNLQKARFQMTYNPLAMKIEVGRSPRLYIDGVVWTSTIGDMARHAR